MARNNLSFKNKLPEKILALRAKGFSYRKIQQKLNCSKSTISYHLGKGQKEKAKKRLEKQRNAGIRYDRVNPYSPDLRLRKAS